MLHLPNHAIFGDRRCNSINCAYYTVASSVGYIQTLNGDKLGCQKKKHMECPATSMQTKNPHGMSCYIYAKC